MIVPVVTVDCDIIICTVSLQQVSRASLLNSVCNGSQQMGTVTLVKDDCKGQISQAAV